MRFAAPAALSGLLAIIVLEILKIIMPPILAWITGMLLVVLKIGLTVLAIAVAALFATLGIWLVMRARRRSEVH